MTIDRPRHRERGHPSEHVGFRCPSELLDAATKLERDRSKGIVRMLDMAHDAREELGELWMELEIFAHRKGITEGEALGRVAREVLSKNEKRVKG